VSEIDLLHLTDAVRDLCEVASRAVLAAYANATSFDAEAKNDGSPLTRADLASHRIIVEGLAHATPDVPVLSEEGSDVPDATRAAWTRYWLVDPLDGTKEFLARNGEFTVNLALIAVIDGVGTPVLGIVHQPVGGLTYIGVRGQGAWREHANERAPIASETPTEVVRVVASRSHGNAATDAFITGLTALFPRLEHTNSGSSLKLCRIAEGSAHYYPRVAPTMAWDTAAAQAVVEAAGAVVWRYGTREPLRYDARVLRNPPFLVAFGDEAPLPAGYHPLAAL